METTLDDFDEIKNDFKKKEALLESLKELNFIDPNVLNIMEKKLAYIYEENALNFEDFQMILSQKSDLAIIMELKNNLNEDNKPNELVKEKRNEAIQNLNELSIEIFKKIHQTKINFIKKVLISSEQESILFNKEVSTKEAIEKRYKKLYWENLPIY